MPRDTCLPCCQPSELARSVDTFRQAELIILCDILSAIGGEVPDNLIPASDNTYDVGSDTNRFRDVYLSRNLKMANNQYIQWENAAGNAWLDVIKADATDNTVINAGTGKTISFAINGVTQWTLDSSKFTPVGINTEDIGTPTVTLNNIYTTNLQGRTGDNLGFSARGGFIDFFAIGTDATPLRRWRVSGSTGDLQQDVVNGGGFIMSLTNKYLTYAPNTTGAGTALLGTNSPAVTVSAPYTWFQMISGDGSTVYLPAWK